MLELNKLYNMDCMEGMAQFPNKYFELAIVDPEYGINVTSMSMGSRKTVKPDKSDRPPAMSDIYGGSAIEQDADGISFLITKKEEGVTISGNEFWEVKMPWPKNRFGGQGTIYFHYYPQYHSFVSPQPPHRDNNREGG